MLTCIVQLLGKGRCPRRRERSPDERWLQGEAETHKPPHADSSGLTNLGCPRTTRPRPVNQPNKPTPNGQDHQETQPHRPCAVQLVTLRIPATAVHQDDNTTERHNSGSQPSTQPDQCSTHRSGCKPHEQLTGPRSVEQRTKRQSDSEADSPNKFSAGYRWILSDKQCCPLYGKQEPKPNIHENEHLNTHTRLGCSASKGGCLQATRHGRVFADGELKPHTQSNGSSQPWPPGSARTQPPPSHSTRRLKTTTGNSHGAPEVCSTERKHCQGWRCLGKPVWTKQLHCSLGDSTNRKPVQGNSAFHCWRLAIIVVFCLLLGGNALQGPIFCWEALNICQDGSSALPYADLLVCMSWS